MNKKLKAKTTLDFGYPFLKVFQMGGTIDDERKKELFPYYAYKKSLEMDIDKYGPGENNLEKWSEIIRDNKEDLDAIISAYAEESPEVLAQYDEEYSKLQENAAYAKKGGTLKKITKKISKPMKKCECGCAKVLKKESGGKISSVCACGCGGKMKKKKIAKKESGSEINPLPTKGMPTSSKISLIKKNSPIPTEEQINIKKKLLKKAERKSLIKPNLVY